MLAERYLTQVDRFHSRNHGPILDIAADDWTLTVDGLVEVSTDHGKRWIQADIGEQRTPWAWALWHATVDLPPGPVTVVARAFDSCAGPDRNPEPSQKCSLGEFTRAPSVRRFTE